MFIFQAVPLVGEGLGPGPGEVDGGWVFFLSKLLELLFFCWELSANGYLLLWVGGSDSRDPLMKGIVSDRYP